VVARATSEVVRMHNTSVKGRAISPEDAANLAGPQRTAAISKHTNAFKINEDVVIPLPRIG
jgi:FAD/FMN-containing dehydrogenase